MREIKLTVYKFSELSDKAKVKAREWWRECENQDFGSFGELTEPYETAAKLLGIEFAQRSVKLMGGNTRSEPDIRWSGFSSQGDGASFVGRYEYKKGCSKLVRKEFPKDTVLHRIADDLTALQKQHGYKIAAKIEQRGNYVHKYTMRTEYVVKGDNDAPEGVDDEVLEIMRDFAEWIYRGLEREYEYRMSDESVDESIEANEYEFYDNGKIA